jgi:RNA polymerase sigma-70 factor (ECF subfamily)
MAIAEGARALPMDVGIVHRIGRGDERAAHELLEAYGDALFRFVLRRTGGCAEDAEEIVQDTFVAAVRMGGSFDGSCSVFTWLCSLARLKIGDHVKLRSRAKRTTDRPVLSLDDDSRNALRHVHDPSTSLEDLVVRLDRVRLVQALLDSMTPDQREVVLLRYVEQFSVREIASIIHRSEKAVERLLERAKEKPRQEMLKWFGDESFRMISLALLTR